MSARSISSMPLLQRSKSIPHISLSTNTCRHDQQTKNDKQNRQDSVIRCNRQIFAVMTWGVEPLAVGFAIPGDKLGNTLGKRILGRIAEQLLGFTEIGMGNRHFSGHRVEMFNICLHAQGIL